MRRIIKTVCATALCAVLLTGCSSPTDEVIKAMAEGNVEQAQQVYAEKISGNRGKKSDFRDKAEAALNDLIEQYNNGTLTEEEIDARFEVYKELLGSEGIYTIEEKKLNELKASKYLFDSANKLLEKGNWKTAYELYGMVDETDANYETAQECMKRIEQETDDDSMVLIAEAQEAFQKGEYEEAVRKAVEGYTMRNDSAGKESMMLSVTEKLAEAAGFDNPIAVADERSISIQCDSFKGKGLSDYSESQIFEIYQELYDTYRNVIIQNYGDRILGVICCNGKEYSVPLGAKTVSIHTVEENQKGSSASTETKKNQTVTTKTEYKTGGSDAIANGEEKDKYGHDKFDAFVIAEKAVKEKLKSPATAKFCSTTEATIGRMDNTWTVKGWVDAQNGLGATVRANFVVTFTFASKDTYSVALCTVE